VSVVVVVHNMVREFPRTLRTLDPRYQREIDPEAYEVIVVDNGSGRPVDEAIISGFGGAIRHVRIDPAPPSPARAANVGIGMARADLVGLIVDGARMASPGLVSTALLAAHLADRPVITAPAWHLGPTTHMRAAEVGYDQRAEDELLAGIGWEDDGYGLFTVATLAGSSWRGWFGATSESSSIFLRAETWKDLGGLDERFDLPGGGLVNHDLYERACALAGTRLVVMLGEGTFHQIHGGAATSRRFTRDEMFGGYEELRGRPWRDPAPEPLYVGRVRPQVLHSIMSSAQAAIERAQRSTST
jgi:hypothetical protein